MHRRLRHRRLRTCPLATGARDRNHDLPLTRTAAAVDRIGLNSAYSKVVKPRRQMATETVNRLQNAAVHAAVNQPREKY